MSVEPQLRAWSALCIMASQAGDGPMTAFKLMNTKDSARALVTIDASDDGLEAIASILQGLPADLPAAVAIVQHRTIARPNLAHVLARATRLPVRIAQEGEPLLDSMIYVAPPDMHITVLADGSIRLVDGPRVRDARASSNPLLESAPDAFGQNVVAVVLDGANIEGTDGVQCVTEAGGSVIAQDSVPLEAIASRVVELVNAFRPEP